MYLTDLFSTCRDAYVRAFLRPRERLSEFGQKSNLPRSILSEKGAEVCTPIRGEEEATEDVQQPSIRVTAG